MEGFRGVGKWRAAGDFQNRHTSPEYLLILFVALLGISFHASAQTMPFNHPPFGPPWPQRKLPTWLERGMLMAETNEPLRWVYRKNAQSKSRTARSGTAAKAFYDEEHSEATILALKEMGVNVFLTSFHKGFGIANERTQMEEARALAKVLHKNGMKMAVYVSALLLYEELYAEFPQARNWNRVIYDGTPEVYGLDGYRYRAFLNHPEYINYMKEVCRLAVEAGADYIDFDTVSQGPENFHPLAQQMFLEWLKRRYPNPRDWFFRTGLNYLDYVKIPHYSDLVDQDKFDQPIMQEYLQFKSQLLADYAAEMVTYIHSLNPETVMDFNVQGIQGANRVMLNSVDHPRVVPWLDVNVSEESSAIGYTPDGRLISKIRSLKIGQQYDSVALTFTGPPDEDDVGAENVEVRFLLAESMAFNRGSLGDIGTPLVYKNFPASGRRYIRFFWDHFKLFARAPTAADVAILRSFASMAYNNYATHRETMIAEQTLIQSQIPFDMIADHNLSDLSKYKVVILADQESLSDSQVSALREYVRHGGGLVATADTARYDEWRRDREKSGLQDVLGLEGAAQHAMHQSEYGSGRAVYLPELKSRIPVPRHAYFTTRYHAPAANSEEFLSAIRWASRGKLSWKVTSPPFVAVEAYYHPQENRYVLHLLNYNYQHEPEVKNVPVSVSTRDSGAIRHITVYSPDDERPKELVLSRTPDGISFTLPALHIYSVITLEK